MHKINPDNSLIGSYISEEILPLIFENRTGSFLSKNFTVEELTRKILNWGEIEDSQNLKINVQNFCKALKNELMNVKEGDLIGYKDEKEDKWKFGRFFRFINSKEVEIKIEFSELSALTIDFSQVKTLHSSLLNLINSKDLSEFVVDIFQVLDKKYKNQFKSLAINKIKQNFINKGKEKKKNSSKKKNFEKKKLGFKEVHFHLLEEELNKDSLDVKKMLEYNKELGNLQIFVGDLELEKENNNPECIQLKKNYLDELFSIDIKSFFIPTFNQISQTSLEFLSNDSLYSQMQTLKQNFEKNINEKKAIYDNTILDYITGKEKENLVRYWHNLIYNYTQSFLTAKGFLENCTAFDYLNEPPLNFSGVINNAQILKSILKYETYSNGNIENNFTEEEILKWVNKNLLDLINEIKELVYPKINTHISNTLLILNFLLHLPLDNEDLSLISDNNKLNHNVDEKNKVKTLFFFF